MQDSSALVIVESPSKAKTIKKILGPNFTVRATFGHIIDLSVGQKGNIGVDIENGFVPKYEIIKDKADKVKAIIDAARSASKIYIASDPDREGEAIAFHVASQLEKLNKPIVRSEFHQITEKEIKRAIQNPRELDNQLYDAQQARRVLDRIVGFMVSPYIANKFEKGLSAGRVQSVALMLIVEREKQIEAHNAKAYYNISVPLNKKDDKKKFVVKYIDKVEKKEVAQSIVKDLSEDSYFIESISSYQRKRQAPPPLTTSTLQQTASSMLKMSVDETMKVAQVLYEAGHITYMRTDSTRLSPESVSDCKRWLESRNYTFQKNTFSNKGSAQDAHEAIRPTDVNINPTKLPLVNEKQKALYKLIWSRFVSSQMTDAIYDCTDVLVKTSNGHKLSAKGQILKDEGWLVFAGEYSKNEKDIELPKLSKSDPLVMAGKVRCEEKKTKPPSRFNEAILVKELENKGIGRPSTYASIIARLGNKNYVKKLKNGFHPTELGRQVAEDLAEYFSFMKYSYTARMEDQLDEIAQGKISYKEMLGSFFSSFKKEFQQAKSSLGKDAGVPCPKCNSKMVIRHGKFGYFAGCIRYPDCDGRVNVRVLDSGEIKAIERKIEEDVSCPKCGKGMIRRDGRFGPFYACSDTTCKGKRKVPFGKKCPACGDELFLNYLNGKPTLCCMSYPVCTHLEPPPQDAKLDWVAPSAVSEKPLDKKVIKVLKANESTNL